MRLKQVKLSGFKSFCDSAEFSFKENGITMVVGPNGCGKSNVVDALRWALGEQSPRLMRSSAMSDVIFSGSTSRKPVGRAEVTLLFDNTARTALEKFNAFTEIAVTRRLYRSGESEYLINKMPSRLMDVRELIMDTGVAGRSYSIVEQGRVDEFVTASPQDRRGFLEEAAGIVRYKTKRVAAEKKLEQTRQNLLRVEDVLAELTRQEASLRDQMEAAKEFRTLQSEVELLRGDLARFRFEKSQRTCDDLATKLAALREEAGAADNTLAEHNARLEQITLEQTQEENTLRESRAAVFAKERDIQQGEHAMALERQNRENTREWIQRLEDTLQELKQHRLERAEQQRSLTSERDRIEVEVERSRLEMVRLEEEHTERRELALKVRERVSVIQEEMLQCDTRLNGIETQQRFLTDRLEKDGVRRDESNARIESTQAGMEEATTQLEDARRMAGEAQTARESTEAQAARESEALAEAQAALAAHQATEAESERECMALTSRLESLRQIEADHEGFGEDLKTFLSWADDHPGEGEGLGIIGPLARMITVSQSTAQWAGDYLAPHLDVVVIEQGEALPAIGDKLEELHLGGIRFLPLDSLPLDNGNGKGGSWKGSSASPGDSLLEFLEFSEKGQALGESFFGHTRVLPEGRPPHPMPEGLGNGSEWLARDGDYHIDGKARVTLGRGGATNAGLLHRRAEIAALEGKLGEAERKRATLRAEREGLDGTIARCTEALRIVSTRVNETALSANDLSRTADHLEREVNRLTELLRNARTEVQAFEEELEGYRNQQTELVQEKITWREKRVLLEKVWEEVRDEDEEVGGIVSASQEELTERKVEHSVLTSKLEGLVQRLSELERAEETGEARLAESEAKLAEQQAKLGVFGETLQRLTDELAEHHSALEGLKETVRGRATSYEALLARVNRAGEEIKSVRTRHEQHQAKLHELDLAHTAEKIRLEQFTAQLAGLPRREGPTPETDERKLENKLASTNARLQRMEGVNLGAPEEYEALEERMGFLNTQREDLDGAVNDLETTIRRMNNESRRRFRETFDKVNEKFSGLFPQVFGGGEARLVLTDSDDPLEAGVDIIAQPPGKKLQSLNLLSGGEKALTAISLIFSFFLHKPSPFCVLDEVDAPLDDHNVSRFNNLIQNMTEHSQFIIITHNKRTMEVADRMYGVTMEEAGVSKIVSVNLA